MADLNRTDGQLRMWRRKMRQNDGENHVFVTGRQRMFV